MNACKHFAGTAKTYRNFIGNKVNIIFCAKRPELFQINRRIYFHTGRTLHKRFNNDSTNFAGVLFDNSSE